MPLKVHNLNDFWHELKRRKVIRVIIVYVAAGFAIIEFVDIVCEPLNLPEWTLAFFIVLVSAGFPVAIIFSWIFDVSSKGIVKTKSVNRGINFTKRISTGKNLHSYDKSIAVLPFQDMSSKKDQEYFCDGIAEEIINALAHVNGLKVIARTSAFSFKNQNLDIREIGQKLDVETLLEGSIRKDSKRLRITVQLIKARDGSHIWSERFDRKLDDIFAIQDEISLAIVDNLKIKLLGNERSAVLKRYTEDFHVYNLYLKAAHNVQLATSHGFEKAMKTIRQALQKDPHFVPGYTLMGRIYQLGAFFGNVPPNTGYPKAKEYAEKALEMDHTSPDAHYILGTVIMYTDWDWKVAEHHFKYAIELNPNNEMGHHTYSLLLSLVGRYNEAILEEKKAVELDPLSRYLSAEMGLIYVYARQFEQAITQLRHTTVTYPHYYMGHWILGTAYQCVSKIDEAIEEYEKAVQLSCQIPIVVAFLVFALYENSRQEEAERLIKILEKRSEEEYVPAMCFTPYYLLKGDHDQAYRWAKRAIRENDVWLPFIITSPIKKHRIPNEPKFSELMDKVGLNKYFQDE